MDTVKVLIVDNDYLMLSLLRDVIISEGWQLLEALNGKDALALVDKESPDLVILALLLPEMDGFEVCRKLREYQSIPIIILSGLNEIKYKVKCLNLGADDYITKPFAIDELVARIHAVLRRSRQTTIRSRERISFGRMEIDFGGKQVFIDGDEVKLTKLEYDLLQELALDAGHTLTYNWLLIRVWGPEFYGETELLYTHIKHLRQKLEPDPKHPQYIICESKTGYRMQIP